MKTVSFHSDFQVFSRLFVSGCCRSDRRSIAELS